MTVSSPECHGADLNRHAWPRRNAQDRADWPSWARWNRASERRYTMGVEQELMLLDPSDFSLAQSGEKVLRRLSGELRAHTAPETHASVIELATGIHSDVAGAVAELAALRALPRYGVVAASMRMLARREPTLALHVHIGVPDPEDAIRVLNGRRGAVPVLLALSANSPFSKGHDSRFASARTVIFQAFPRTGTARRFSAYADYIGAVDALIASGALPDPSFLWWDVRLQPALGTVEVRVMDARTTVADTAALITLVHSLVRLELEGESVDSGVGPEVLAENRFLAARDGLEARLIDPERRVLVPVRALLDALLARCRAHADAVGSVELDRVRRLATANGAERQRLWAREDGLVQLVSKITQRFAAPSSRLRAEAPVRATL
jgi:glutamate---cysteine ligase / carboxylate-amine ligase